MTVEEDILEAIPYLKNAVKTFTANKQDQEDIVQDTLLKAWKHRDSFTPNGANTKTWIGRILKNTALLHAKKRKIRQADSLDDLIESNHPSINGNEHIYDGIYDHLKKVTNTDQYRCLELYYIEGFSYEEIATLLERPLGTVQSRISRGKKKIGRIPQ
ncbi:RNA polymerase sigma factor [candidate division KSB1 bacterium]